MLFYYVHLIVFFCLIFDPFLCVFCFTELKIKIPADLPTVVVDYLRKKPASIVAFVLKNLFRLSSSRSSCLLFSHELVSSAHKAFMYVRPDIRNFVSVELSKCSVLVVNGRRRWGKSVALPDAVCSALNPAWIFLHSVAESGMPIDPDDLRELLYVMMLGKIPVLLDEFQRCMYIASSVKQLADNLAIRDVYQGGWIVLFGSHQTAVLKAGLGVMYSCHRVHVTTFPAPGLSILLSLARDRGLDRSDFLLSIAAVDSNLEAFGSLEEAEQHLSRLTNAESILQQGNLPGVDWLLDADYVLALTQALLGSQLANPKITNDLHRLGFLKKGPKNYEAHDPVLRSTSLLKKVIDWRTQKGNLCGQALEWMVESTELQIKLR